jgi:hypothetical protein
MQLTTVTASPAHVAPADVTSLEHSTLGTMFYTTVHGASSRIAYLPAGLEQGPFNAFAWLGGTFESAVDRARSLTRQAANGAAILEGSDHQFYAVSTTALDPFVFGTAALRVARHSDALVAVVHGARMADLRSVRVTPIGELGTAPSTSPGDFAEIVGR